MSAANRRKGHDWEVAAANYLAEQLGCDVRTARAVSGGVQDGPDLVTVDEHGHVSRTVCGLTVECKNKARFDLAGWVDQADHGLPFTVVVKRRHKPVSEAYAVMPLRVFVEVLGQHRAGLRGTGRSDVPTGTVPVPRDTSGGV